MTLHWNSPLYLQQNEISKETKLYTNGAMKAWLLDADSHNDTNYSIDSFLQLDFVPLNVTFSWLIQIHILVLSTWYMQYAKLFVKIASMRLIYHHEAVPIHSMHKSWALTVRFASLPITSTQHCSCSVTTFASYLWQHFGNSFFMT